MIKIFEDDDSALDILSYVMAEGVAGIAGGRMSTRNKLGEVRILAEEKRHPEIVALSTFNHFWGELAFIYSDKLYDHYEAQQVVVDAYDKQLAEEGIYPDTYPGSE
ncbi:hypothetical protein [Pseudomonas leptonychotis]|uniref:hypothetical protein n=1 Tax=Pseudomonas leptonychotis TaxID=2448482 RepID=UPI0038675D32